MVILNIGNDTKIDSKEVSNNGKSDNSKDFRYFNNLKLLDRIFIKLSYLQIKKFKTIYFLKLNRYLTYKLSFFADKIIKKIFKKN